MQTYTQKYKEIVEGSDRKFYFLANAVLQDGTKLTLTDEDLTLNGLSIDTATSDQSDFTIGSAVIGSATLNISNANGKFEPYDFGGAVLTIYVGLLTKLHLDGTKDIEYIKKGVFNVDSVTKTNEFLTLECLDNLCKADVDFKSDKEPTLFSIWQAACTQAGLHSATLSFYNQDMEIENEFSDTTKMTCREVMSYVATLSGNYVRANADGDIELKWYTDMQITSSNWLSDDVNQWAIGEYSDITGKLVENENALYYQVPIPVDADATAFIQVETSTPDSAGTVKQVVAFYHNHTFLGAWSQEGSGTYSNITIPLDANKARYSISAAHNVQANFSSYTFDLRFISNQVTTQTMTSSNMSDKDITVTGVSVAYKKTVTDADGNETQEDDVILAGTDDYAFSVENNPLINEENANTAAVMLNNKLNGFTFPTFSVSLLSNPALEAGDTIFLYDRFGNRRKSYVTNLTYEIDKYDVASCTAASAQEKKYSRYTEATKLLEQANEQMNQGMSAWLTEALRFNTLMANSLGLYTTVEKSPDGSTIYYMHSSPKLEDSQTQWKLARDGFAVSNDYGKTWRGIDKEGNVLVTVLSAIGINADWINAGTISADKIYGGILTSKDGRNFWNLDTGEFALQASAVNVGDSTLEDYVNDTATDIANSATDGIMNDVTDIVNDAIQDVQIDLTQENVFNALTNGGQTQGIYLSGGKVYINGTYLSTGIISSNNGTLKFNLDQNILETYNSSGQRTSRIDSSSHKFYYNGTLIGSVSADNYSYGNNTRWLTLNGENYGVRIMGGGASGTYFSGKDSYDVMCLGSMKVDDEISSDGLISTTGNMNASRITAGSTVSAGSAYLCNGMQGITEEKFNVGAPSFSTNDYYQFRFSGGLITRATGYQSTNAVAAAQLVMDTVEDYSVTDIEGNEEAAAKELFGDVKNMTLKEAAINYKTKVQSAVQNLSDEQALEYAELYPNWTSGVTYTDGTKARYEDALYKYTDNPEPQISTMSVDSEAEEGFTPDKSKNWIKLG